MLHRDLRVWFDCHPSAIAASGMVLPAVDKLKLMESPIERSSKLWLYIGIFAEASFDVLVFRHSLAIALFTISFMN